MEARLSGQSPVLDARGLAKQFGATYAVKEASFAIQAGEVFTLLGPSGCGKTTTLRMVAGLEEPTAGEILLGGRLIVSVARGLNLAPDKRNMGMVFQSYAIWPHMTVFDNVAFPLQARRVPRDQIRARVLGALATVELKGFEDRPATRLSGGQQQRIALARALVFNPEVLLLDEPLSNLDANLREQMRFELKSIQRRVGLAMLLVTHDHGEAMTLSDRVAVMNAGTIEQVGSPTEVYERPATPFVRDFLGRVIVLEGVLRQVQSSRLVALGGDGVMLAPPNGRLATFAEGQALEVACRPEDVRIAPPGAVEVNHVPAIVEQVAYVGERLEYRVRTAGDREFVVFGTRRDRFDVGQNVHLVFDLADATLWPV